MSAVAEDYDSQLLADMGKMSRDPYKFVLYAFPWGEGELAGQSGPDEWQTKVLKAVRDGIMSLSQALRYAVASGHGVGKSALVAWLLIWAMATHENTRGVVTANTEAQLRTKTWPELSKWYRLCVVRHWFTLEATSLSAKDPQYSKTWRIDAIPWSERNTEAFAGLHNQGNRIIVVFDEASAIADSVWEVTEGALTDAKTEILWFAFGNPTRNNGRFHDLFGRLRDRWMTFKVDSRTARMANKDQIEEWRKDYGEDSDFFRVRVRGEFPNTSTAQMIPSEDIDAAMARHAHPSKADGSAKVIGVDPARFGQDKTTIWLRQGIAARKLAERSGMDNVAVAGLVGTHIQRENPAAVFVDEGGVGAGVVDILKTMGNSCVVGVQFGGGANDPARFANRRAEMWWSMREWLHAGAVVEPDRALRDDLVGPEYSYTINGKIKLESKDDMKARGLASPDNADALALTFAAPVAAPSDVQFSLGARMAMARAEYDVLA